MLKPRIARLSYKAPLPFYFRSVGGIRVSMYNAVKLDDVKALADFMRTFRQKYQKQ